VRTYRAVTWKGGAPCRVGPAVAGSGPTLPWRVRSRANWLPCASAAHF